jgi:hypothetical protein
MHNLRVRSIEASGPTPAVRKSCRRSIAGLADGVLSLCLRGCAYFGPYFTFIRPPDWSTCSNRLSHLAPLASVARWSHSGRHSILNRRLYHFLHLQPVAESQRPCSWNDRSCLTGRHCFDQESYRAGPSFSVKSAVMPWAGSCHEQCGWSARLWALPGIDGGWRGTACWLTPRRTCRPSQRPPRAGLAVFVVAQRGRGG